MLWARDNGLIGRDKYGRIPTDGIKNAALTKRARKNVEAFPSWEEIDRLVAELKPRYRNFVIVMAALGLRPEEVLALRSSDVDFDEHEIAVSRRFTDGQLKDGLKREDEDSRTIPFAPESRADVALRAAASEVLAARAARKVVHLDDDERGHELLFPAPRCGFINLDHFRRLDWSPALRAAGLPNHRIYDLRTSFLTWGVEAGLDLGTLADIAGTSTMQLSNTYVRPTAHSKRAAMAAVDGRKAASR